MGTLVARIRGNISHHCLQLRLTVLIWVLSPRFHAYACVYVCVYVHSCVKVCTRLCGCFCLWGWVTLLSSGPPHLIVALFAGSVYSLLSFVSPLVLRFGLLVWSSPVGPVRVQVCVWKRGQQADTHYQQVQPVWRRSVRVRGRRREELHGGFCQRYVSHCLWRNPPFSRQSSFFLLGLANTVIWALRELTALFPPRVCVCHLFIWMLLCQTVACCSLLSAHSFLMGTGRVFMLCFLSCIFAVALYGLLCCHIHEFHWYVCFWRLLWLIFNWNINILWYLWTVKFYLVECLDTFY